MSHAVLQRLAYSKILTSCGLSKPKMTTIKHLVALSLTLLQVFLERRSGADGLTRILILVFLGITSIGHTTGSELLEDGGGAGELGGGGESRGGGHKGSDDSKLVLCCSRRELQVCVRYKTCGEES